MNPATVYYWGATVRRLAPRAVGASLTVGSWLASALYRLGDAICRHADNRAEAQYRRQSDARRHTSISPINRRKP